MYALVDSNVIIYSLVESSPKKQVAQKFIKENRQILCVSHQVILESLIVLTHPKFKYPMNSQKALKSVWGVADALNIISPNVDAIILAKELIKKYKLESNRIFDTYLIATALSNSVDIVASDNVRHLKVFKEVKLLNPF